MKRYAYIIVVLGLIGCQNAQNRLVRLSESSIKKTVMIQVNIGLKKNLGAGVLVSKNGHILSAAHLFSEANIDSIFVCNSEGTCVAAEVIGLDVKRDLALLRSYFDLPTKYAKIEDQSNLKVGQETISVGYPLGLDFSVCHGIISSLRTFGFTQSDTMINPGNSGGPVFNYKGKLIGINSYIISVTPFPVNTGIGFSVNALEIHNFLKSIKGFNYDRQR